MTQIDALGLTRLLQLVSPALPVGAYSYSQGLESAIDDGIVADAATAEAWIQGILDFNVGTFDAPIVWRLSNAAATSDHSGFRHWNNLYLAGRETAELRAETLQMGSALVSLTAQLRPHGTSATGALEQTGPLTFPAAFCLAAYHMSIEREAVLLGYLWSWLENQVIAAVKAIPLGQTAGQRMLSAIGGSLPATVVRAQNMADDELSNFAPGLAIASSRHETQYSRLFRS
jgi:urease accessory protein